MRAINVTKNLENPEQNIASVVAPLSRWSPPVDWARNLRPGTYCTVSWVLPTTPFKEALMVIGPPVATAVASPPGLVIVATLVLLEVQLTDKVMLSPLLSVAVYCS